MAVLTNAKGKRKAVVVQPPNESAFAKIRGLMNDFETFSTTMLNVQTPESKIVPFELNGPQKLLHKMVCDIEKAGRLVRIVALKARRMGFSTYFSARFYKNTAYSPNRYAIQITHEPEATDTLFKMVKRFYNLSPEGMKPETLYNNMRLLEFNNKDGTGLGSGFRVATAGKEDLEAANWCIFAILVNRASGTSPMPETCLHRCCSAFQTAIKPRWCLNQRPKA
jgi:hypothetical protein